MFPSPNEWYDTVLHPEDTHPWDFRQPAFYDEYKQKYAIAKMVRPKSILEIGVRFGYSAASFLMAVPDAHYTGVDFDEPSWGPYQGVPREWAEKRLKAKYSVHTLCADTQKVDIRSRLLDKYDLVHIYASGSWW